MPYRFEGMVWYECAEEMRVKAIHSLYSQTQKRISSGKEASFGN
jgi:hypothetical protein